MATDQEIRDKGIKFLPQQKYLQSPYQFNEPVVEEIEESEAPSFGIPNTNAFTNSGENNFNLNTTYTPNYDYRQYAEYGMNPSTLDRKNMDMNQEFFYGAAPSQTQQFLNKAINYVPYIGPVKRGMQFLGNKLKGVMPINKRSIFENELRGAGIYTDDIGRIVTGQGVAYNTPQGIMSGYNANQMTDKTFDKRTDNIRETLTGKYGLTNQQVDGLISGELDEDDFTGSQYKLPSGKISNIFSNIRNIELSKQMFKNKKDESDKIYEFEKKRKEEEKLAKQGKIRLGDNLVQDTTYKSDPALSREGRENYTGPGQAFEARTDTFTGGKTVDSPSTPGGKYGSPKKDGGRVGYFFGGRVNYKAGGRTDAGPNRTTASKAGVGQINESGQKVSGGNYNNNNNDDGSGNNPPLIFSDKGVQIITDQSKLGFNYPTGLTKNLGIGQLTAILDAKKTLEEEEPEGFVQYDSSIGPINTSMSYDTIIGPEFNANYTGNNYGINYNTNTGLSGGYSKQIGPGTFTAGGSLKPDGTFDTEARYGITFANGGLASIL